MTTTTTVVTKQVTHGGTTVMTTGNRDWNTGVLGCCDDCGSMCYVFWCPPCAAGGVSTRIGENCCVPIFVPGGLISMRTKIRLMLGIQGSICNDCMVTLCCGLCSICQMKRELDAAGWPQ